MRPTLRMLHVATGWTLLGLAAAVWPGMVPLWTGAGYLLLAAAVIDLLTLPRKKHFEISRKLPGRFALGVPGEVTLNIQHRLRRPLTVTLIDGLPPHADAPALPWHSQLAVGAPTLLSYDLHFDQRGRHRFDLTDLLAQSLLGLWQRRIQTGSREETRCYPNYEPVVRYALLATSHREEQMGIVKRRRSGATLEFHQLREYQDGDVLSRVDWRATSRRNELISRDFEEQRNQTILLVPDCGRRMHSLDGELTQFDHCLNAMLLLSYIALRQCDEVGVMNFGGPDRWLKPVKGTTAMPQLLNHLYDYEVTEEPSDFTEAAERILARQRRRALVVFLTNLRSEDSGHVMTALQVLRQRHLVMLGTLREAEIDTLAEQPIASMEEALAYGSLCSYFTERQQLLRILRGRNILTLDETAQNFPIALVNSYLDLKAAGTL